VPSAPDEGVRELLGEGDARAHQERLLARLQVAASGVPATLVAIVGPSLGTRHSVEQFTLATVAWRLAKKGVDLDTVAITLVSTGAVVAPTDYDLEPTADPDTTHDYYVDVTRAGGGTLSVDTPVFIEYDYTDPTFYDPRQFNDYEDVKDAYGEPLNLTPATIGQSDYVAITSPLSLAAKIAFENGAGTLVLVATTPPAPTDTTLSQRSAARRAALSAAYAKISANYDINVVVPITEGIVDGDAASTGVDLRSHVETASDNGYFRIGLYGLPPNITTAPDTLVTSGNFRSRRVVLAYASAAGLSYFNGAAGQSLALGNQYLAAAYAGRLAALPAQKALTREILRSFAGIIGTPLSNSLKNQYAAAGVALTEPDRIGRLVVRHGLSTDPTDLNSREISLVRARDAMLVLVQLGVDNAGLIGQPIGADTPGTVKSVVAGLLEHAKLTGIFVDYADLQVRQRSIDPSVIEVRFGYSPAYPLNYVVITISINVATGETVETAGQA
jgi:hypothetical protein